MSCLPADGLNWHDHDLLCADNTNTALHYTQSEIVTSFWFGIAINQVCLSRPSKRIQSHDDHTAGRRPTFVMQMQIILFALPIACLALHSDTLLKKPSIRSDSALPTVDTCIHSPPLADRKVCQSWRLAKHLSRIAR